MKSKSKFGYDLIILVLGLFLSFLGMAHNMYASRLLLGIIEEEKHLHISKQFDEKVSELFERKLAISMMSYRGIILIASGFILNVLVQVYSKLYNH